MGWLILWLCMCMHNVSKPQMILVQSDASGGDATSQEQEQEPINTFGYHPFLQTFLLQ